MCTYPALKYSTQQAEKFLNVFKSRILDLCKNGCDPSTAVTIVANLIFHGQNPLNLSLKHDDGSDDGIILRAVRELDGNLQNKRYNVGNFIVQYNSIRGFRPNRSNGEYVPLDLPFDPSRFNYCFPGLEKQVFYRITYGNLLVDIMFNKYPFAPYHFLWIPNRESGHNQFLDPNKDSEIIDAAWNFVTKEGLGDGVRLGYNSNGAHASINHLHFQGFFLTKGWEPPLDQRLWSQTENTVPWYSSAVWIPSYRCPGDLKRIIRQVNERYERDKNIAFNLYMTPDGVFFFPRKNQGDGEYQKLLRQSPFTTGYAFFEMTGEIVSPIDIYNIDRIEEKIRGLYDVLRVQIY